MTEAILFYSLAATVLISAVLVISRVNPLMSALWLVIALAASAAIFALLAAPFLAVIQILVYAGAVMVLFIFVIMLIDLGPEALKPRMIRFGKMLGGIAALYLAGIGILSLWRPPFAAAPPVSEGYTNSKTLGDLLLTKFTVPFELASILLLVAMVGALVMGKKRL